MSTKQCMHSILAVFFSNKSLLTFLFFCHRPWHVFVDVSPATDADFVVAATFDNEPGVDDVNCAIVECLEGSEREDEIVAQQMQQALDMNSNQLNELMNQNGRENDGEEDDTDDDDEYDDFYDLWNEDSV